MFGGGIVSDTIIDALSKNAVAGVDGVRGITTFIVDSGRAEQVNLLELKFCGKWTPMMEPRFSSAEELKGVVKKINKARKGVGP
jgi:hypothetical protein